MVLGLLFCGPVDGASREGLREGLQDALVAHWDFGDAALSLIDAVDQRRLILSEGISRPGPHAVAGAKGLALSFDGVDDLAELPWPADGSLDFGRAAQGQFSIALWVRVEGESASSTLVDKRGASPAGRAGLFGYRFFLNDGVPALQFFAGDRESEDRVDEAVVSARGLAPGWLLDGQWHHLVVSARRGRALHGDDGSSVAFFVDGRRYSATPADLPSASLANTGPLLLGSSDPMRVSVGESFAPFRGALDEVMIFATALDASAVERLMQHDLVDSSSSASSAGIVSWIAEPPPSQERTLGSEPIGWMHSGPSGRHEWAAGKPEVFLLGEGGAVSLTYLLRDNLPIGAKVLLSLDTYAFDWAAPAALLFSVGGEPIVWPGATAPALSVGGMADRWQRHEVVFTVVSAHASARQLRIAPVDGKRRILIDNLRLEVIAPDRLRCLWTFDGPHSDAVDDAVGGALGFAGKGTSRRHGCLGFAAHFDGTENSGIELPVSESVAASHSDFSISLWLRPEEATTAEMPLVFERMGARGRYLLALDDLHPVWVMWGEESQILRADARVPVERWTHLVLTVARTGRQESRVAIYLDGRKAAERVFPAEERNADLDGSRRWVLGRGDSVDGRREAPAFFGALDDVAYYDAALGEPQIRLLAAEGRPASLLSCRTNSPLVFSESRRSETLALVVCNEGETVREVSLEAGRVVSDAAGCPRGEGLEMAPRRSLLHLAAGRCEAVEIAVERPMRWVSASPGCLGVSIFDAHERNSAECRAIFRGDSQWAITPRQASFIFEPGRTHTLFVDVERFSGSESAIPYRIESLLPSGVPDSALRIEGHLPGQVSHGLLALSADGKGTLSFDVEVLPAARSRVHEITVIIDPDAPDSERRRRTVLLWNPRNRAR